MTQEQRNQQRKEMYDAWKPYAKYAHSLSDFLDSYYDNGYGMGVYGADVYQEHTENIEKYGFTTLASWESVTKHAVAYYPSK